MTIEVQSGHNFEGAAVPLYLASMLVLLGMKAVSLRFKLGMDCELDPILKAHASSLEGQD